MSSIIVREWNDPYIIPLSPKTSFNIIQEFKFEFDWVLNDTQYNLSNSIKS